MKIQPAPAPGNAAAIGGVARAGVPAAPPAAVTDPVPAPGFDHVFDFPTLAAGDRFRIARGSTAGGIAIGGEARVDELTPTSATVWLKAGRFGFNREATISLVQSSPTSVTITAAETGKPPASGPADIVAVRTNYSEFKAPEGGGVTGAAVLQVNDAGQFVLDVAGSLRSEAIALHLVLEKLTEGELA